jgi:hypothetical protein
MSRCLHGSPGDRHLLASLSHILLGFCTWCSRSSSQDCPRHHFSPAIAYTLAIHSSSACCALP